MSCLETAMADYYTHFSCLLDVGTPENAARALDLYNALAMKMLPEAALRRLPASIQRTWRHAALDAHDVTGDPSMSSSSSSAPPSSATGLGVQYANG